MNNIPYNSKIIIRGLHVPTGNLSKVETEISETKVTKEEWDELTLHEKQVVLSNAAYLAAIYFKLADYRLEYKLLPSKSINEAP